MTPGYAYLNLLSRKAEEFVDSLKQCLDHFVTMRHAIHLTINTCQVPAEGMVVDRLVQKIDQLQIDR